MSKNNHRFLTGQELLSVLSVTKHSVKWIEASGDVIGHVPVHQALIIVKSGNFIGKCGPARVLYIKEHDVRKDNPSVPAYWDGRACGLYRWADPIESKGLKAWDLWAQALKPKPVSSLEVSGCAPRSC